MPPDELAGAQSNVQRESERLVEMQREAPLLTDKLRDALTQNLQFPELTQRNEAITNFMSMAPRVRQEATDLLSREGQPARPSAVEDIVSQRRGTALLPIMNLTSLSEARRGGVEDVITRGTNAFQSLMAGQQGQVSLAQQNLDLAINALTRRQEAEQQRFANEFAAKQITGGQITLPSGETLNIPSEVQRTLATKTGGGGGGMNIGDFLDFWNNLNQTGTPFLPPPTEPQPQYSPREGEGAISPQGQWTFTGGSWQQLSSGFSQPSFDLSDSLTAEQSAELDSILFR